MTFDEFMAVAKEVGGLDYPQSILRGAPDRPWGPRNRKDLAKALQAEQEQRWLAWESWENEHQEDMVFHESWCIGGVTGGTCWGGTPNIAVDGEVEPPFSSLDELLLKIVPNLSFLLYRKMESELITRGEHGGSGDYYGNHTNYADKTIRVKDLYDFLKRNNLV